jgi:hypothetical protein
MISLSYHKNTGCKQFRKEQVSGPSLSWFQFSIMPPIPQKHPASSTWSGGRIQIQGPATEALEYALLYEDDGFVLRSNGFHYDLCAAFDDAILLKSIQLLHPPIFSHDSKIYHKIPIEYNDSYMNVIESENCSPIVSAVPWGTGAIDMDYWCKVESERHNKPRPSIQQQASQLSVASCVCDCQELKFALPVDPSTAIIIPNEGKNFPSCTCMCCGQRRGLSRSYACSSLSRLEGDLATKITANHS